MLVWNMMDHILFVCTLLLLCIVSSDSALRLCASCECIYKDGFTAIDCNNRRITELDLLRIQTNSNMSFVNLNFSNNNISIVPVGLNTHEILGLDLSMNHIKSLKHLNRYKNLVQLNLAYNSFEDFENEQILLPSLEILNMSHCSLKSLKGLENSNLAELTTLDVSNNEIEIFDGEHFKNMTKLSHLDLSYNLLTKIDVMSFVSLKILNVENNRIEPYFGFGQSLLELNAQNNMIRRIFVNEELDEAPSSLTSLYLHQNKLTNLPNISFPSLKILDLSQNNLMTVPKVINSHNFPVIETLDLSKNNFRNFEFNEQLRLLNLKINSVSSIRKITENTFKMLVNYDNRCMNISIKDSQELYSVENSAFEHLDICFLDLSNNSLSHLPRIRTKTGDWRSIENGVNFQLNPIVCDCESQWILDDYMSFYYKKVDLEYLFLDLRCADPYYLRNYRLVHWYNWTNDIFCQDELTVIAKMRNSAADDSFKDIFLRSSGTMLLVLIICIAFLAMLFIAGLVFAKRATRRRTRRNRRF